MLIIISTMSLQPNVFDDWSMTILGYREHTMRARRVIGVSHACTYLVLRFAETLGFHTGWVKADPMMALIEDITPDQSQWVALTEMFAEKRVDYTEGMISGSLVFMPAVQANGEPPEDRDLKTWAKDLGAPWIEIVDNEYAYFCGFDDEQIEKLLVWFISRTPLEKTEEKQTISKKNTAELKEGLFEHGWTRNLALVKKAKKPICTLWGGAHENCLLNIENTLSLSSVQKSISIVRHGAEWRCKKTVTNLSCPLDDKRGRQAGFVTS